MEKITYTEKELEDVLHIKQRQISELRKQGYIKAVKIGRTYIYPTTEIERFLTQKKGRKMEIVDILLRVSMLIIIPLMIAWAIKDEIQLRKEEEWKIKKNCNLKSL